MTTCRRRPSARQRTVEPARVAPRRSLRCLRSFARARTGSPFRAASTTNGRSTRRARPRATKEGAGWTGRTPPTHHRTRPKGGNVTSHRPRTRTRTTETRRCCDRPAALIAAPTFRPCWDSEGTASRKSGVNEDVASRAACASCSSRVLSRAIGRLGLEAWSGFVPRCRMGSSHNRPSHPLRRVLIVPTFRRWGI
jgi:hypothetical protein